MQSIFAQYMASLQISSTDILTQNIMQRILLITDGTVTDILSLHARETIQDSFRLSIILADDAYLPWYYQQFVQIYSQSYTLEHSSLAGSLEVGFLGTDFVTWVKEEYSEMLYEIHLDYALMKHQADAVTFLKETICGFSQ